VNYVPLVVKPENQVSEFEAPESSSRILWREIGSRTFARACITPEGQVSNNWIVVQPHRYRYLAGQSAGDFVQAVFSEYLAWRVMWS
jgi:hypothetical protein